jgi:hypothetical protein
VLVACNSCTFEAAAREEEIEAIFSSRCLVCNAYRRWMVTPCSSCNDDLTNAGDDGAVCDSCDTHFSVDALVDHLNDDNYDDYTYALTPANCAECDGYHTVIGWQDHFVCLSCIEYTDDLEQCGWCGEGNTGDMQFSGMSGCSVCDGNVKLMEE